MLWSVGLSVLSKKLANQCDAKRLRQKTQGDKHSFELWLSQNIESIGREIRLQVTSQFSFEQIYGRMQDIVIATQVRFLDLVVTGALLGVKDPIVDRDKLKTFAVLFFKPAQILLDEFKEKLIFLKLFGLTMLV